MELWDLYDRGRKKTGLSQIRGEPIPKGHYHLVVHVWIRNGSGEYLISQRSPDREKDPLKWECVGGSALMGEDSLSAASREVQEEVGAAIVFPDEKAKSVYVGRIFIDSLYHRKGYGTRLMKCIEKIFPWAAELNLDTPCWNKRTNAFYQGLGYRLIKTEGGFNFYQKKVGQTV